MFSIFLIYLIQACFCSFLTHSDLRNPILIDNQFLIEFKNVSQSGNFSNFYLYQNSLYVTGTNYVFKLNFLNISDNNPNNYKEVFINPSNLFYKNSSELKNHIKLLIFRERSKDLIICGTNMGKPHIKDLNMNDFSSIVEFDGFYLCPGVEGYKNLGYISYENPINSKSSTRGLMYSAIWKTDSNIYGEFFKYGIYRQEIDLASKILKTLPDINWLWEPNFISIIDYADKMFYFFTEYSIEEYSSTKKLKRISRAARVCKSDMGLKSEKNSNLNNMWQTFRKVNFNCEKKYFNLILIKQIKLKLIAVFYDEELGSIICEIDLEKVKIMLESKKFWINREIQIDKETFHLYNEDFNCDSIPGIKKAINYHANKFGEDGFLNELSFGLNSDTQNRQNLDILNEFLTNHTILDNQLVASKLFKLHTQITCMSFDDLDEEILFFSTSENQLIVFKKSNEEFSKPVLFDLKNWIKNGSIIEIFVKKNSVYIGSTYSIFQIKFKDLFYKFCASITNCFKCNNYFFCTWINHKCDYAQIISKNQSCSSQIKEINFTKGENLKLDCIQDFHEDVKWKKDQISIEQTNLNYFTNRAGQLYLINLSTINNGIYSCYSKMNEVLFSYKINYNIAESQLEVENYNENDHFNSYTQNLTSFLDNFNLLIDYFNSECLNNL